MTAPTSLSVRVPQAVKQTFEEAVAEKWSHRNDMASVELERELRSFLEESTLAKVEELIDRLVLAAGRRPRDAAREKNYSQIIAHDSEERNDAIVNYHVDPDVRLAFKKRCETAGDTMKDVVSRLMIEYAEREGTVGRSLDKLRRVADDAESFLAEIRDDTDETTSVTTRREIKLAEGIKQTYGDDGELPNSLPQNLIEDCYHELNLPPTRVDYYTERVIDRLDLVPDPRLETDDVYILSERRDQLLAERREAAATEAAAEVEEKLPDRPEPDDGGEDGEGDEDEPPLPETQFRDSVDKWRNGSDGTEPATWIIRDWLEEYGLKSPPDGMALENWPPDASVDATAPGEEAPYVTGD